MACVLVIDDYEELREAVKYGLSRRGHSAIGARDAIEAMRVAEEHQVDLVLLDLGWPWRTGLAVCARLRREQVTHALPVVLMAPQVTVELQAQARAVGAAKVVAKPFEWPALIEMLERGEEGRGGGLDGGKIRLNPFSRLPGAPNRLIAGGVRENPRC